MEMDLLIEKIIKYGSLIRTWTERVENNKEVEIFYVENLDNFYNPECNSIVIPKYGENSLFHEMGHAFFHKYILKSQDDMNSPEIEEIDQEEMYDMLPDDLGVECVTQLLDLEKKYGASNIRIYSDYVSMFAGINVSKFGLFGHNYPFLVSRNRLKNETFAEVFSALAKNDTFCLRFLEEYFPRFLDSCFQAIDKILV